VVIPARIAWAAAAHIIEHGRAPRGYLGLAGQPVTLTVTQRSETSRDGGLLVVGVTPDSPAAAGGVLVGDVVLDFDGREIAAADDLLDLLSGRAGQTIDLRVLRGAVATTVQVHVGERPEL
jgi:S1-C subfamily serine protease